MIAITFPDGKIKTYNKGITGMEVARGISPRLAAEVLAMQVDGVVTDIRMPLTEDASVRFLKWEDEEGKQVFWHSSSHVMAAALETLFPGVKFGIGPAVENGFYYDIDLGDRQLTEADLQVIEKEMYRIAHTKQAFERKEISKKEALEVYKEKGDQYKCELINDLEDGTITFYTNGAFTDLCRGPHIPDTSLIRAIKLTSIAGAYWRG
ncbi:MAG TPA: TGS domain-containing protein, partial [Bacteroidales bacterium]|nr:TGS domain-containing protein [Bacteroidales bacterium]